MLRLYNTLTRKTEEFKPLKDKKIGMYACGPTVYNFAHIGNLRAYVFEDILKRVLIANGYSVEHITNITDVGHLTSDADTGEDKMEKGARREGKTAWEIAKFFETAFLDDLRELNILPANKYPRATDHIKEQIELVKKLEGKGYTYKTSDGIYFDTSKLSDYGKLAGLKNQKLEAGKRVEMGGKKNPTDFALWKFSPSGEKRQMEWESPWGVGFPGWHIECSAMATKYLGQPFDIHCGGIDHIPVHHTNEIAQTEAASDKADKDLAKIWMHSEFLNIKADSENHNLSATAKEAVKMAKSGENFITLQSLKDNNFSPLAYRYFLLQAHYRKQLTFSWEALESAQNGLSRLYFEARGLQKTKAVGDRKSYEQFLELANNDLDLPGALALVWEKINEKKISQSFLLKADKILGLQIKEALKKKPEKIPTAVMEKVKQRDEARKNKSWQESDRIRRELEEMNYIVEDTKEGTKIRKK